MNLSAIDVNLVVALDALLRERSVTRAAKRMGLSQSAMSHTLTRLREALGDPLLVRVGRQMTLTERAESLAGRVGSVVQELETLFGHEPAPFDPAGCARAFRLAISDEAQLLLLPTLERLVAEGSPRSSLHAMPLGAVRVVEALRSGDLDLALGPLAGARLPADVRRAELASDRLVGLVRLSHPRARGRLDLDAYLALEHLRVGQPDERDPVDELLAQRGLTRRVAVTVPHLLLAPHVIAGSDRAATVPSRVATVLRSSLPIRAFELPFDVPRPDPVLAWHDRAHPDPAHRWLRRLVTEASSRLPGGGRRQRQAEAGPRAPRE